MDTDSYDKFEIKTHINTMLVHYFFSRYDHNRSPGDAFTCTSQYSVKSTGCGHFRNPAKYGRFSVSEFATKFAIRPAFDPDQTTSIERS